MRYLGSGSSRTFGSRLRARFGAAVHGIVDSIMNTGDPVIGVEVAGQRADQTDERLWVTYWHPLRNSAGEIVGVNVAATQARRGGASGK